MRHWPDVLASPAVFRASCGKWQILFPTEEECQAAFLFYSSDLPEGLFHEEVAQDIKIYCGEA